MSIYTKYIEREADLNEFINNRIFTPSEEYYTGRIKGWGKYYEDHKVYLDSLWNNLTDERKKDFEEKAQQNDFFAIHGQVKPNVYSPSRAAKRLMARDWHKGKRYFAGQGLFKDETVVGMGGGSGQERGLDTYTIFNHGANKGDNVIRLNEKGDNFRDQTAKNNTYENFGQSHWTTQGQYEARALPGNKFLIKNGKLTYDDTNVGKGLKDNYDAITKSFNDTGGGNYKGLMEGEQRAERLTEELKAQEFMQRFLKMKAEEEKK